MFFQYSIKFRVVPDAGVLVMRRFHYAKTEDGAGWEVTKWTDDATLPVTAPPSPSTSFVCNSRTLIRLDRAPMPEVVGATPYVLYSVLSIR